MRIKLDDGAITPKRAHSSDAGIDLMTPIAIKVKPKKSVIIDTGVHAEIPYGCVGFLKSKSGLNVKYGLTGEGVIDAGYTGSIVVKLYNLSKRTHRFSAGDKIIQLVIVPIITPDIEVVDVLEDTERGNNGFGSSGK